MAAKSRPLLIEWLRPIVYLGQNPLSLTGAVLTTSSAITLLAFWAFEILKGGPVHPYTGIVFFLILPGVFVLGLLLMPIGGLWRRYRLKRLGQLPEIYPKIDLGRPFFRRALVLISFATFLNVVILGVASYKGVEHMDSVEFCGLTCHSVMAPEYTAYVNSPHSRVACVECHIGPGAPWFVRAKISGVRQVFAVTFDTYSRPIPSPVENLRPARETCEHCHWPQRFSGDKLVVRTHFADDEQNTKATTVLLLKVGGRTAQGLVGIHGRHLNAMATPGDNSRIERIDYTSTDGRRQVIPVVSYLDDEGKRVEYRSTELKPTSDQLAAGEHRAMDCMDCHNRPTHAFQLPEKAVDLKMADGLISPELPFAKKKAVELLRTEYPDRDTAAAKITTGFIQFYRDQYPQVYQTHRAVIESSAEQVRAVYLRNIFPSMKLTWGSYPNNIGHEDFLGCFRCHDGSHETADGKTITNDCSACHELLAMEETDPEILAQLGMTQ